MISASENVAALKGAILEEARADADAILNKAAAEAQDIQRHAETRATAEARRLLRETREQADTAAEQANARARLEAHMLKLQRREALLEQVFERANTAMISLPDREDWPDAVRDLIREAVERLGGTSFTLLTDRQTREMLDGARISILSADLRANLTLGAPLETGTGVIVLTSDGHRRYDNTLEARLERIQDELRAAVYRILTGEQP